MTKQFDPNEAEPEVNVATDWIDSDPAFGVEQANPVLALAGALRAGIDCHGTRHFSAQDLPLRQAQLAQAQALASAYGIANDLASYGWMTNGFALPINDPYDVSGPKKYNFFTLNSYIEQENRASKSGGGPGLQTLPTEKIG